LGVLKNWIDKGSLPAIHVGRRVRIKRSDFDRLVESGYRAAGQPSTAAPSIWEGDVPLPEPP
jgi:Helix-turn-helix domain